MISEQEYKVIEYLADGQFHSGAEIGKKLQITRSAIWKIIQLLHCKGIFIERVHGKGYRIPNGVHLYSSERIFYYLPLEQRLLIDNLVIHTSIDSTNNYVLKKVKEGAKRGLVCLAEEQTAGRGRCQRHWVSPFAKNIYLSLLWSFHQGPSALTGLTLVIGIAIVKALLERGLTGLTIKWPNDIYSQDKKLAGVLTEMFIDDLGVCHAVIGVGINVDMPADGTHFIDKPFVDCTSILGSRPNKNQITATVLKELLLILPLFEQQGWNFFREIWHTYDCLYGCEVTLITGQRVVIGIAKGVDKNGGLMLEQSGIVEVFNAGEVSVRKITR